MDYLLVALSVLAALFFIGRRILGSFGARRPACCEQAACACQSCPPGEDGLEDSSSPPSGEGASAPVRRWWSGGSLRVWFTGLLALACIVLELDLFGHMHLTANLLGVLAVIVGGYPLSRNAWRGLRRGNLNVDALVIIAAGAALLIGDFLEAATVIFILLLGEELEAYTVSKAQTAVKGLAHLLPDRVRVWEGEQQERLIPIAEVREGMIVIVKPGERIPVDGKVAAGNSAVDQSPITGESLPVEKAPGQNVYSGSLNLDGALQIRATRVGEQTTVAHVKRLIEEAKREKAPIQRLVDRYTNWFVPLILLIAGLVFFFTRDLERAITVLIVACPCAFVLGTPIAVVAAIGSAARQGILIKGGAALEAGAELDSFVFDKTGTLTYGTPEIVKIKTFCSRDCGKADTLTFAAVAEKLSEHPLAEAVLQKAKEWELMISTPDDFVVKRGQGIVAEQGEINIVLGNRSLLRDNDIQLPAEVDEYLRERERLGETALLVAHHKQVCGVITLSDSLRSNAPRAIRQLRELGINKTLALYTGDNYEVARKVARKLGIEEFDANLLPEEKVEKVRKLIRQGYRVGMVGDGINDAPALASAHVGIAMGVGGSELAVNAADIALLTDDLGKIPLIIRMSRRALRIIRQNLWFALLFNGLMLLCASAGVLSMIGGALVHQLSSLGVILNSMRLISARQAALPRC